MAEDDLLPNSLEKLEIASHSSLESEAQPTLESLSLVGDDCPRVSCSCNKKTQKCASISNSAWNNCRFINKPFQSRIRSSQNFGIIRKSRFKPGSLRSKTWILREPILKLESLPSKEDLKSNSSAASSVCLEPKPPTDAPSDIAKLSLGHVKSQGKVFGACASVSYNDFSVLRPSKSTSEDVKGLKKFQSTSYRHIRLSTPVSAAPQPSKVVKRKKEHRSEGSVKSRPISDSTNTHPARQASNQPSGSRSTSCSQQARMVGTSHVSRGSDDVTIDELASYFDLFVHIPRKMSHMAENMYI